MRQIFSNDPQINKKNAIELLQTFINTKLDGDKNKLRAFSFWGIENDKDFGNGLSYADGDRTKVAYAIDYLLFYKAFEGIDFRLPGYSTKKETFSGETLNTFNTLFSSDENNRTSLAKLYGIESFKNECYNPDNKNTANDFYHVYQRLGNFTILPCLTINGHQSINTYKGTDVSIKDYLYPFLKKLEAAYKYYDSDNIPESLNELVSLMKQNSFFFENDKANTFDKFISLFMLDGWEQLELKVYLNNSELNEDNIEIVNTYIKKATRFIENRTNKIVDKLINILGDYKRG
ncbi:MAG: hypothetical protein KIG96_11950 [Treponema sp.]|nr:hypothetical protein [Treponema sp.]